MAGAKRIGVALQGGGAHGAFTWGVLECLLDEIARGSIELVGVSGASAGALNGAALAYGMREGAVRPGPATARAKRMAEGARTKLEQLWENVARAAFWGGNPFVAAIGVSPDWNIDDSPAAHWADMAAAGVGPSDLGISNYLNSVLREVFPELPAILALPEKGVPMLMVAATDVEECRRQLFVDGAVSPDALKASACLPTAFQAVTIAGSTYWDGGYMGNPPLTPLVDCLRQAQCDDLVMITLNPLHREGVPRTARQIMDRLNEITFSASLVHEVNAIETINRLIDADQIRPDAGYRRINLHRIHCDEEMAKLGIYSKDAPSWDFLKHLRELGHEAFKRMWPGIGESLGKASTWDTKALCDRVLARTAIR
ncbi:MAG: patatin-like phospholipase family protein [Rhodospirillaceae bacterium]|nr:patatin-like phospholipase family protein [Rhodospirillales bacterium]